MGLASVTGTFILVLPSGLNQGEILAMPDCIFDDRILLETMGDSGLVDIGNIVRLPDFGQGAWVSRHWIVP